MKIFKKSLSLFAAFIIAISCFASISVFAAPTSSLHISKTQLTVGEQFTVSVTFKTDEQMMSGQFYIKYNPTLLKLISGDNCNTSTGMVSFAGGGKTSFTNTLTFETIAVGEDRIYTSDSFYVNQLLSKNPFPEQGGDVKIVASNITTDPVPLSSNAFASSIKVSSGSLSPKFNKNTTNYNVVVANNVTKCDIYVTAEDAKSKVNIQGSASLSVGKNVRKVIITAQNGTQKTYTINITRSEEERVPDEPPAEEPIEVTNPLETEIGGVKYIIATDLTGIPLFNGFTPVAAEFKSAEISVAVDPDGQVKVYYLQSVEGGDYLPYFYREEYDMFERLQYLTQGSFNYILFDIPSGYSVPKDYYVTNLSVKGIDVNAYTKKGEKTKGFYYLYCYCDGAYGFYRYDSLQDTLQRYPELKLQKGAGVTGNDVKNDKNDNVVTRFASLSTNAKIIVIALIILALTAIALIILLIIKFINGRKNLFIDDEDQTDFSEFETINIMDNSTSDDSDEDLTDFDEDNIETEDSDSE